MRFLFVVWSWLVIAATAAAAEDRVALVVGNSAYSAVTSLDNPVNDAALVAAALEKVGFRVTLLRDAALNDLKRAIAAFGRDLRTGGPETVGLFYFAGHGVQSFGANYLLPVDANPTDAADLDLVALEATSVLRQMASARNRTNIVILDACRNNPFEVIPELGDNGLAEMKAPTGTFLAYATAPGAVALDGTGGNSPFTEALAEVLPVEGLPIEQVFREVRIRVIEETGGAQTPWDTSSLTQEFVFNPARKLTPEELAEEQFWQSVRESKDAVQVMLFLRAYPGGRHEEEARELLASRMAEEAGRSPGADTKEAATVAPAAPPAAAEQEMFEAARVAGTSEAYQAFLDAHPDSVFAELARIEIAAIAARAAPSPEPSAPAKETVAVLPPKATEEAGATAADPQVFFDRPLTSQVGEIDGLTMGEVITQSPLFPPIDGLPDEVWKGKTCSSCHQWTRDALCDQAKTYQADNAERSLLKPHPFGGDFKNILKNWGSGGCQ